MARKKFDLKKRMEEIADVALGEPVRIQTYIHVAKLKPEDKEVMKAAAIEKIERAETQAEAVREIVEWAKLFGKYAKMAAL